MGLLDRFSSKAATSTSGRIFQSLFNQAAPDPRGADYLDAYSGWVYAATNVIAQHGAKVPLRLERKKGDSWVEVKSHLVLDTLNDANPLDTRSGLAIASFSYLSLVGESFWFVVNGKATKKPAELYPLDPTRLKVAKSSIGHIAGFAYRNEAGQDVPIDTHEAVFLRRFHPKNRFRGMGPLQAAAVAVDTDNYAGRWNRNFFFNSATVESVLEVEGTLTEEQFNRLRSQWDEKHQGTDNAHKTAILEGGLKYKPISPSQRDMQFLESRRYSRDEILGIFGVPKSMVSVTDDVNLANAHVHERIFAANTIEPLLTFYTESLTEFLLPLFGLDHRQWRLSFDTVVPTDMAAEITRKEAGIRSGFYTINEVREEEGLEPVDGGDVPLVSTTLQPLTSASAKPEEPTSAPPTDDTPDSSDQPDDEPEGVDETTKTKSVPFLASHIHDGVSSFEQAAIEVVREQGKSVVAKLLGDETKRLNEDEPVLERDQLVDQTFQDFENWDAILAASIAPIIASLFQQGAERTFTLLGSGQLDLANPTASQFIASHGLEAARGFNHTMKEEIKQRLILGLERGESVQTIAKDLQGFYHDQSEWRALRLARTEVMKAYGEGSLEGARQSGMREKLWVTDAVADCDECLANQRMSWIPLGKSFSTGHTTNPAHPNCTCSIAYRAVGETI